MDRQIPGPGDRYVHFKGGQYQVLCVAEHSETKEQMVVYQALYGDFACYVRPLWMFMSKVDRGKYPEAEQEYQFERIAANAKRTPAASEANPVGQGETGEESADPALLRFLDADTLEQKYQVLKALEGSITNRLIDDFAVALDLVISEGSVENRYFELLNSVRTMQRFENTRFR